MKKIGLLAVFAYMGCINNNTPEHSCKYYTDIKQTSYRLKCSKVSSEEECRKLGGPLYGDFAVFYYDDNCEVRDDPSVQQDTAPASACEIDTIDNSNGTIYFRSKYYYDRTIGNQRWLSRNMRNGAIPVRESVGCFEDSQVYF